MTKLVYQPTQTTLDKGSYIPDRIIAQGLLSDTSHAYDCFVKQKFSANLQAFMISYVVSVSSYYSVYK